MWFLMIVTLTVQAPTEHVTLSEVIAGEFHLRSDCEEAAGRWNHDHQTQRAGWPKRFAECLHDVLEGEPT